MDEELKQRLNDVDAAIDRLFELHGLMSPRLARQRPAYLRDAGEKVETIGGRQMLKPSTAR